MRRPRFNTEENVAVLKTCNAIQFPRGFEAQLPQVQLVATSAEQKCPKQSCCGNSYGFPDELAMRDATVAVATVDRVCG